MESVGEFEERTSLKMKANNAKELDFNITDDSVNRSLEKNKSNSFLCERILPEKINPSSLDKGNSENVADFCQTGESQWNRKHQRPFVCDRSDSKEMEQSESWQRKALVDEMIGKEMDSKRCKDASVDFDNWSSSIDDKAKRLSKDKCFRCGEQGCDEIYSSLTEYEAHYRRCHNFACSSCQRFFASDFLLDVHIQENHDSYFQILSSRSDMYRCLVETCNFKFRTAELRRDHMVSAHNFSSNFSFHPAIKDPKLLPAPLCPDQNQMDIAVNCTEPELTDILNELESEEERPRKGDRNREAQKDLNQSFPKAVCFGQNSERAFQRVSRGGRRRHWHQFGRPDAVTTVDIQCVDMNVLADSLS